MNFKAILRYLILSGIFILPFSVFIVSNSLFFPYITGKNFFFRIVVEIIFAAWAVLAIADAKYRPKFSWLLGAAVLFVALIGLSDLFGVNPARSFWSNFERMEGYITLLHLLALLFVLIGIMNTEKLWSRFWNTLVAVSIIEGFYVLSQIAGLADISFAGTRVDGTLGNAIYLGGFMLVMFFVTCWLLYRTYAEPKTSLSVWKMIFYLSAMMLQVIGIFASGTRGSMLGFFGGLMLIALILALFAKRHPRARKISVGIVLIFLIFSVSFIAGRNTDFVQNNPVLSRLASISLEEGTGAARLKLWSLATEGFKERPILGWGQENYIQVFTDNYNPELYNQEPWFDRAHNIVINWLVVGGILGVLSFLSIWFFLLWFIWKKGDRFNLVEKSILTGLLAAYFFHNLFVFDNIISYLLLFSLVGFIGLREEENEAADSWQASSAVVSISSAAVVVILIFVMWQVNIIPINTSQSLIRGISLSRAQDPRVMEEGLMHLEKAQASSYLGREEARAQTAIIASTIASTNAPNDIKSKYFQLADSVMDAQREDDPNSARMRLLQGVFLASYGQFDKAEMVLKEGIEISPKYQRLYTTLGDVYLRMGEYEKAIEVSTAAWELNTSYHSLRTEAVRGLFALGKIEEARDAVFNEEGVPLFVGGNIIQGFIDAGDRDSAEKLLKAWITEGSENPQVLASAAAAYVELGDREMAIQLLEEAMAVEPRFIPQGEQLIREIEAGGNPLE